MITCQRCGVDFDGMGDYCIDCIEVDHDLTLAWTHAALRDVPAEVQEAKAQLIHDLWLAKLSDRAIAERLGISDRTVLRWRKRLGLGAVTQGGHHDKSYAEREADLARISEMTAASRLVPRVSRSTVNPYGRKIKHE